MVGEEKTKPVNILYSFFLQRKRLLHFSFSLGNGACAKPASSDHLVSWSHLLFSQIIFENRGYSSDVFYHILYIGLTQLFCFKRSEHSFAHIDFAFYIIDYLKYEIGSVIPPTNAVKFKFTKDEFKIIINCER